MEKMIKVLTYNESEDRTKTWYFRNDQILEAWFNNTNEYVIDITFPK